MRVVVITGAGRAFCAGLDLSEPPTLPSSTRVERLDPYAWVGTWVRSVVRCEKPVIAAVNGAAAGAGFGLALACDVRIVAASARMTAGYVRRGLSPDAGVSYFLPRHVGLARASDILLTGRDVDADGSGAHRTRDGGRRGRRVRRPRARVRRAARDGRADRARADEAAARAQPRHARSTPRCVTSS